MTDLRLGNTMKLSPYWANFFYQVGVNSTFLLPSTSFLYCWQQFDTVATAMGLQTNFVQQVISGTAVLGLFIIFFVWMNF